MSVEDDHRAEAVLDRRGRLAAGEAVLVNGAETPLGQAVVRVAARVAGRTVAIVSSDEQGAAAVRVGADQYVLRTDFRDAVLAGGPIDLVVDLVGGDATVDLLRCLNVEGRLVVVEGAAPSDVRVNRLLLTNTSVIGAAVER